MKFQVGDKVVIKHTQEEAEVVSLVNETMVLLEIRGVRFPAYMDQLEFPYFQRFFKQQGGTAQKDKKYIDDIRVEKKPLKPRTPDGVWLTFIPVYQTDEFGDEVVEELKIHLENRTERGMHFCYDLSYVAKPGFEFQSDIQAFEDFYLHDIPFENLNDSPLFSFEFSLIQHDKKKAPYHGVFLKLKAKTVFQRILQLRQSGEAHFSYSLLTAYPDKKEEEWEPLSAPAAKGLPIHDLSALRRQLEPARSAIDLHIEVLEQEHERLSSLEKLTLQLSTFEKYLDLALLHQQSSLIVIHGVGSGKLRDEIHALLTNRREVKQFFNRYHPSYGYGATEIFFAF